MSSVVAQKWCSCRRADQKAVPPVPGGTLYQDEAPSYVYGFGENTQPNSHPLLTPDTEDAKSERIRQLHLTLGALIDERDELQDTLSSSASLELAQQLESAQAELQVLRKYASGHTSGRNSFD